MSKASVTVMIHHPTKHLGFLSDVLGLPQLHGWVVGEPRQAPNGEQLSGVNRDSYWGSSRDVSADRGFKDDCVALLAIFEREKATLRELIDSGGRVRLFLQLPGSVNNGDELAASQLKQMGELGIDFSIEVFPDA